MIDDFNALRQSPLFPALIAGGLLAVSAIASGIYAICGGYRDYHSTKDYRGQIESKQDRIAGGNEDEAAITAWRREMADKELYDRQTAYHMAKTNPMTALTSTWGKDYRADILHIIEQDGGGEKR